MQTLIHAFNDGAQVTATGGTVEEDTQDPVFAAGGYDRAVTVSFDEGSGTKYLEWVPAQAIDVSDYDRVVVSIASMRRGVQGMRVESDANYAIEVGSGNEYKIAAPYRLAQADLLLDGITSIDRIRVRPVHDQSDVVVVSYMVAVKQDLPLDIFTEVRDRIQAEKDARVGTGIEVGTVTGSVGDKQVTVSGDWRWIDDNAVIVIGDGGDRERHQVRKSAENVFTLDKRYDGVSLVNDQSSAPVYLDIPVQYGFRTNIAELPGIAVWGFSPDPIVRGAGTDEWLEAVREDGTLYVRREGNILEWTVQIACESRDYYPLALATETVRNFLARRVIWVNGRSVDFFWNEVTDDEDPGESIDDLPRVIYNLTVEVKEDAWQTTRPAAADKATTTVSPK